MLKKKKKIIIVPEGRTKIRGGIIKKEFFSE